MTDRALTTKARTFGRGLALAAILAVAMPGIVFLDARPAAAQTSTVIPAVDCVEYDPGANVLTGHFGYINTGESALIRQYGTQNNIDPYPHTRPAQPSLFLPGRRSMVWLAAQDLTQETGITWSVSGVPAKATNNPALYCDTDVSLSQSAAPEPVLAGGRLTYTLTVTNDSQFLATGVTVRDQLPGGVDLVSAEASRGTCSGTETVTCDIGTLQPDRQPGGATQYGRGVPVEERSARVTIVVETRQPGTTLVNTASASTTQADEDASDNAATTRTPVVAPPSAATGPAGDLTHNGAALYATVDPNGSQTTYRFEYGTDASYGQSTPEQSAGAGMDGDLVRADVNGLEPGTTYHYRIVATNTQGTTEGADKTFTTAGDTTAPTVTSVTPKSGTKLAKATANVTAAFSEKMDRSTLNRATVKLVKRGTRVAVGAKITVSADNRTATLDPNRGLVRGAAYTATITTGAKDPAGNPLARDRSWSFTVRR